MTLKEYVETLNKIMKENNAENCEVCTRDLSIDGNEIYGEYTSKITNENIIFKNNKLYVDCNFDGIVYEGIEDLKEW